jgi:hypothetical protein
MTYFLPGEARVNGPLAQLEVYYGKLSKDPKLFSDGGEAHPIARRP